MQDTCRPGPHQRQPSAIRAERTAGPRCHTITQLAELGLLWHRVQAYTVTLLKDWTARSALLPRSMLYNVTVQSIHTVLEYEYCTRYHNLRRALPVVV